MKSKRQTSFELKQDAFTTVARALVTGNIGQRKHGGRNFRSGVALLAEH
jgi:hypothetical protein